MIFTRVVFTRPGGSRHLARAIHHGHTTTSRRQLAAWDTAVEAWRRIGASSGVNVAAFHGYKLAERSWEFLTNLPGPDATAYGY